MSDEVYKINLRSGDMEVQFQKAIQAIFAKRTAAGIAKRVAGVIDREISKVFYYTAIDIFQSNFGDIQPYSGAWRKYSSSYQMRKLKRAGHLKWFSYGAYYGGRAGEEQLSDELFAIPQRSVLQDVGQAAVSVARDNKTIRVSIAPRLRFSKANMERQFIDLLSESALNKLQNRKRAYRALLGPEFMFMLNERIPSAVSASLRRA